jgi:hypothetical protein
VLSELIARRYETKSLAIAADRQSAKADDGTTASSDNMKENNTD